MRGHRRRRIRALAVTAIVAAAAEHHEISSRRATERKAFTDAEITDGFFKTAFGAELHLAGSGEPHSQVRWSGAGVCGEPRHARPRRPGRQVVDDIRARMQHLDIAMTENAAEANVVVTLVRDRDLPRAINKIYGPDRAQLIQRSLVPQCLASFRKDESFRITHSDVIVVADAGDFIFYDCVYEELLQALGPINDTSLVPWTMFNDNVQMGFFDIYDQYILNVLYDPRVRPGMDIGRGARRVAADHARGASLGRARQRSRTVVQRNDPSLVVRKSGRPDLRSRTSDANAPRVRGRRLKPRSGDGQSRPTAQAGGST